MRSSHLRAAGASAEVMNRPVPGPLRLAGAGEACGISQLFPVSPGALTGSADMTMRSGPGRAMACGYANRALPGRRPGAA